MHRSSLLVSLFVLTIVAPGCGREALGERFEADPTVRPAPEGDECAANGGSEPLADDVDYVAYACENPNWTVGKCSVVDEIRNEPSEEPNTHVSEPETITYEANPPTRGPHRPQWAKWGEYEFLAPQRWIHNMEHGGVVALYHPCASDEVVDALRALMRDYDGVNEGEFRWILTPYPALDSTLAIVAWQWVYQAPEYREADVREFIDAHYNMGPEDVGPNGGYERRYLGR